MKARKEHSLGTIVKPYELGSEDIKK